MIRLARSQRVTDYAQAQTWLGEFAGRFVAGPSVTDAIDRGLELQRQGIAVSMFYLGEYVTDPDEIELTVRQLRDVLAAAAAAGLDVAASVDPTQIGLMADEPTCRRNARALAQAVLEAAPTPRPGHDALMIDMEDAGVTRPTLDLYWALRGEGLPVAVTVQSYLHRTRDDLGRLIAQGAWVRLVKGAFSEPASAAVRTKADRDSSYRRCVSLLLSPAARTAGVFPALATHDHRLIEEAVVLAEANGWPADAYEFEFLYGVRPELQRELAARGHRVRAYLPFGSQWFPYAIRRVGESPRNLKFAAAALSRAGLSTRGDSGTPA